MDGNQTTETWQGRYRDDRGYEKMWVAEEVPLDWKEENLIKLQEKEDLTNHAPGCFRESVQYGLSK